MKKINILLGLLLYFSPILAQDFPSNGISYQAMLTQAERVTYGTTLKNIPVANTEIKAKFELSQLGAVIFTDNHQLITDINGIFTCIIGKGNTIPFGSQLSDINWGIDSVIIRVFIDAGDGEELFSEQKLWSTAYALHASTSGRALNDKDTSATNELQYINLAGDSVKLTSVFGGISLKPWTDGIAKNAQDIATEKLRSETSEFNLSRQLNTLNNDLTNNQNRVNDLEDSLADHRAKLNSLTNSVNQNSTKIIDNTNSISINLTNISNNTTSINTNKSDIGINALNIAANITSINTNQTNIKSNVDSLAVLRSELDNNRGDINKNNSDITSIKTNINSITSDISSIKSDIATNQTAIANNTTTTNTNKTKINAHSDSIAVHRSELSKNRGDINSNKSDIGTNKTDINTNKTNIATNKNTIDNHIATDKDIDNTNELSDLSFNSTTNELNLDNPKTIGNQVNLSSLKDNLGNHKANQNIELTGKYLSNDGGNEGIAIDNEGRVGIGTNTPSTGALLDISSTTAAFLPPRMTESQRNAINNTQVGSIIFNKSRNKLQVFIDSTNGDYNQLSNGYVYDGPYHAQTFRPSTQGKLSKLRCVSAQRFTFVTYLNCDVYEGDPSGTLTSIGTADSTIKMTNPTGLTFPPKVIADFTFNNLNKVLEVGKTYTFVFVAKDSTTGEPRQCWFSTGTNSTNSLGEYWRGSTISGLTSPNSQYDMEGTIELIYDSPKWVDLH